MSVHDDIYWVYASAICLRFACITAFATYAIWFWVRKPESIVINSWISDMNGWFTLYFLIISAMNAPGQWWYIFPVVSSVILFFISLIRDKDEVYVIHQT